MRQKVIMLATACAMSVLVSSAFAKRSPPKVVTPVAKDGIEYSAPVDREGFVVATWVKTGRKIWSRQVYVIKYEYKLGLESDIQSCFITELELQGRKVDFHFMVEPSSAETFR